MKLTVHNPEKKPVYDIVIEKDFSHLCEEMERAGLGRKRLCIVADSRTAVLYAEAVASVLIPLAKQTEVFVFPEGEANKTLDTVRKLYAFLIEKQFDRKDCLVALGGGVVGDLTGFAAATYLRGIDFVQIPTTLLAQSDSSVGGKTGVDFDGYKNMVGAFCMPKLVYMNVSALKTLDQRTYLSGMGEVIKHGYIKDSSFLAFVQEHAEKIRACDEDTMVKIAYGNCQIKRGVVEEDPAEKGIRALLNFGHTLGHAIEKQLAGKLYHGECVSIGMVAAAYISHLKGHLSMEQVLWIKDTLQGVGLPVNAYFDLKQALLATKNDKKMQNGSIRFVLLKQIGEAYIDTTVTMDEMQKGLEFVWTDREFE